MNTNLPAVQDAIHAAIVAQSPDCRVSLGYPLLGTRDEEIWIALAGGVEVTEEWTGGCSRSESQQVDVFVWVQRPGGTPKGVRDRAFALHAALEDALAADRTLGGIADYASVTRIEIDEGYDEGSVMCGIRTTVAVDTTVA